VIPDAEGSDVPALAQLVSVLFEAAPLVGSDGKAEIFSGTGSVSFGAPNDGELPITQVLGCKYARFTADLPYGKVLKTFTEAEIKKALASKAD
jgi:hypothetical protein